MRILGLDVGSKTIGVACSDALLITAQGVETIRRKSDEADFARLHELIKEKEVHCIVVGKPRHMNGDYSDNMKHIEEFVQRFQKTVPNVDIVYWDERLTTIMAQNVLKAAILILQNYLDAHAH